MELILFLAALWIYFKHKEGIRELKNERIREERQLHEAKNKSK